MYFIKDLFEKLIPSIFIILFPFEIYLIELSFINLRPVDLFIILTFPICLFNILFYTDLTIKFNLFLTSLLFLTGIGSYCTIVFTNYDLLAFKYIVPYIALFLSSFIFINFYNNKYIELYISTILITSFLIAVQVNIQFYSFVLFGEKITVPFCDILNCSSALDAENFGAWGFLDGLMRPSGFFLATNRVGTYLIPGMLLSVYLCKINYKFKSFMFFILCIFLLESIVISLARNSILPAIFGLFFICSIYLYENKKLFYFFLVLSIIIIFSLIVAAQLKLNEALEHFNPLDIDSRSDISNIGHASQHFVVSTHLWIKNLGLGLGFQNYDIYVFESGMVDTFGAHSNFLTVYGETGPIGLFFYTLPFLFVLSSLFKLLKYPRSNNLYFLYALAVSFISLFIAGLFRTYYLNLMSVIIFTLFFSSYKIFKSKF